jgi:hypothetical protein
MMAAGRVDATVSRDYGPAWAVHLHGGAGGTRDIGTDRRTDAVDGPKEAEVGEATAERRLEAALVEQEQLTEQYERATGTPAELTTFARLQAANLRVAMCRRVLRFATARPASPST